MELEQTNQKPLFMDGGKLGRQSLKNLISDNRINWGNYGFQQATHQPVPKIPKNSETHSEIINLIGRYKTFIEPCQTDEIAQEIYKLQGHYWQQGMPLDLMKAVAADYARLLGDYSLPILQRACDEWKLSPAKFYPKLGELKEKMDALKVKTEQKIKRLSELLENTE